MNHCKLNNLWVLLIVRILRRARREVSQIIQFLYVFALVVPTLLLKGLVTLPLSVRRGHETILIFSKDLVVKIATSARSTIELEYLNCIAILQRYPLLAENVLHYQYYKNSIFSCLVSERLFPVPIADALTIAVRMRMKLDKCDSQDGRLAFEKYSQIRVGLDCVQAVFGEEVVTSLRGTVEDYLAKGQYHVGFSHGDFHSRNIMRNRNGCDILIDLDCVRFDGIEELDALYFALEMAWSNSGTIWTETLAEAFDTQGQNIAESLLAFSVPWSSNLGTTYFLDRIGQDVTNYGFYYTREQMSSLIIAIQDSGFNEK
jgi:hypothetical protein